MKKISYIIFLFCYIQSFTQDITVIKLPNEIFKNVKKEVDTTNWKWKRGGIISINLAQGSLSNWAAGGDDFSMAINSAVNYYILHKAYNYTWDNSVDFNFGYVQASSIGGRKNDDRIDILSKFGYRIDTSNKWYASGLLNFRSQFFDGYNYSGGTSNFSSTFLSPAYLIASVGLDLKPSHTFSMFLSPLTTRRVLIVNNNLSKQGVYGVPAGKHSVQEIGFFSTLNFSTIIGKNIMYRGRLDLFSNYNNNPFNIDVFTTNVFTFKINKMLSATYNLDLIYDDDIKIFGPQKDAPRLQLKSIMGIGFLYRISPIKL